MWANLIDAIKKALVHLAEPTLSQETVHFEAMCRRTHFIIGETPDTNVPVWTSICDEVSMRGLHRDHWFYYHLCTNKTKMDEASDTNNANVANYKRETTLILIYYIIPQKKSTISI